MFERALYRDCCNCTFANDRVVMRGGAEKPLCLLNPIGYLAKIRFTRDCAQSAPHEPAGVEFRVSADDLQMELTNLAEFEKRVSSAAAGLSCSGLLVRAKRFRTSLAMIGGLLEGG